MKRNVGVARSDAIGSTMSLAAPSARLSASTTPSHAEAFFEGGSRPATGLRVNVAADGGVAVERGLHGFRV
jgi:hypothetical protein